MEIIFDWKPIELSSKDLKKKIQIGDRSIEVSMSPYAIPKAYRAIHDESRSMVGLELQYLNPEEDLVTRNLGSGVEVGVSRFGNRVVNVMFTVDPEIIVNKQAQLFEKRLREVMTIISRESNLVKDKSHQRIATKAIDLIDEKAFAF